MEQPVKILEGYSDLEKGAYLGAIASIATADRSATKEELGYVEALCDSASLSAKQKELIMHAATTAMADHDLERCLDVLKNSELRFSLVSDVIAFAQSDANYSEEEKHFVQKIATYLGVNKEQVSLLDQFTKKAVEEAPGQADTLQNEQAGPSNFFDNLGFGDKMKNAGINSNSLMKGALGILGPILLMKMFSGRSRSGFGGGGLLGGLMGGGLAGLLRGGGGLLGGILGGGRGFGNAGGMLGRIFGGNKRW